MGALQYTGLKQPAGTWGDETAPSWLLLLLLLTIARNVGFFTMAVAGTAKDGTGLSVDEKAAGEAVVEGLLEQLLFTPLPTIIIMMLDSVVIEYSVVVGERLAAVDEETGAATVFRRTRRILRHLLIFITDSSRRMNGSNVILSSLLSAGRLLRWERAGQQPSD